MDIYKMLSKVVTLTFHLCDKTLFFFWQVTMFWKYMHTPFTQIDTDEKNTFFAITARCHLKLDCHVLITHNSKRYFWCHVAGFTRKYIPCSEKKGNKQISTTLGAEGKKNNRVEIMTFSGKNRLKKVSITSMDELLLENNSKKIIP